MIPGRASQTNTPRASSNTIMDRGGRDKIPDSDPDSADHPAAPDARGMNRTYPVQIFSSFIDNVS